MKLSSLLRTWNLNKAGNKQAATLVTINLGKETFSELSNSRTDHRNLWLEWKREQIIGLRHNYKNFFLNASGEKADNSAVNDSSSTNVRLYYSPPKREDTLVPLSNILPLKHFSRQKTMKTDYRIFLLWRTPQSFFSVMKAAHWQ